MTGSAACNQESKALYGCYSRIQPVSTRYLRPFNRRSSSLRHGASSLGTLWATQEAAAL